MIETGRFGLWSCLLAHSLDPLNSWRSIDKNFGLGLLLQLIVLSAISSCLSDPSRLEDSLDFVIIARRLTLPLPSKISPTDPLGWLCLRLNRSVLGNFIRKVDGVRSKRCQALIILHDQKVLRVACAPILLLEVSYTMSSVGRKITHRFESCLRSFAPFFHFYVRDLDRGVRDGRSATRNVILEKLLLRPIGVQVAHIIMIFGNVLDLGRLIAGIIIWQLINACFLGHNMLSHLAHIRVLCIIGKCFDWLHEMVVSIDIISRTTSFLIAHLTNFVVLKVRFTCLLGARMICLIHRLLLPRHVK